MPIKREDLVASWLAEERVAHIQGWDFSHIHGRYEEEEPPWDYGDIVRRHLTPDSELLDIDTGGGEFLLSLGHDHGKTSATEGYAPNIAYCEQHLVPLGIRFKAADGGDPLPFQDESFGLIINRHGDYLPQEMYRLLKPGGTFITQQVGAENDRDLVRALLPHLPSPPYPTQYLNIATQKLAACGFSILQQQEAFGSIRFYDIGALVWFARIIEWEFPGFSVEKDLQQLLLLQQQLERDGAITGRTHRYLIVARKPTAS